MSEVPHIQQYLQLRNDFMGYLYAITRDVELSEEIYQNAAVVVIEKNNDPEKILNFRAWAKEVVRRQALHALNARQTATRHARIISPELLDAVSDTFINDSSDESEANHEFNALGKCLNELPKAKRKLITLRYEKNITFTEISERIGSTPAAVQRSLSRIRKLLHGCIQKRIKVMEGTS